MRKKIKISKALLKLETKSHNLRKIAVDSNMLSSNQKAKQFKL